VTFSFCEIILFVQLEKVAPKRLSVTVPFEPAQYRQLRLLATAANRSLTSLVRFIVVSALAEGINIVGAEELAELKEALDAD